VENKGCGEFLNVAELFDFTVSKAIIDKD